jgi:hypothetical protein
MGKCYLCGEETSFWTKGGGYIKIDGKNRLICRKCQVERLRDIPEIKEQIREMNEKFKNIGQTHYPQLTSGNETVVILEEGDAGFQRAVLSAEAWGYELINTSTTNSFWTPFTKYTLIFKKQKVEKKPMENSKQTKLFGESF